MSLKLKFVQGCGYETYNTKAVKKASKEEEKANEEIVEVQEAPVPLVTHVNTICTQFFSKIYLYINNQQLYNSNGSYAHKSYISNNFEKGISEYKGALKFEAYDYEEFPDEITEALSPVNFFHKEVETAQKTRWLHVVLWIRSWFFLHFWSAVSKYETYITNIQSQTYFYMISDNPKVSLVNVDCSLYTRRIALKVNYHRKRIDMLAYIPGEVPLLETLVMIFIFPAWQNQFI